MLSIISLEGYTGKAPRSEFHTPTYPSEVTGGLPQLSGITSLPSPPFRLYMRVDFDTSLIHACGGKEHSPAQKGKSNYLPPTDKTATGFKKWEDAVRLTFPLKTYHGHPSMSIKTL